MMNPSKRISTSDKRSKSQQETYSLHINKAPYISALSESFIPTKGSCLMTLKPPSQESTLIPQHRQDFEKQIRQSAFCGNDEAPVVVAQTKPKSPWDDGCVFFSAFFVGWLVGWSSCFFFSVNVWKKMFFLKGWGMMLKICKSRKVSKKEYQSK